MKESLRIIKAIFKEWGRDRVPQLAAALSYYAVFSIGPILFLLIWLLSLFIESQEVQNQIMSFFEDNVGQQSTQVIGSMLEAASRNQGSALTSVLGIGILIVVATGVLTQLQFSLNTIWNVRVRPELGLKGTLRKRLLSLVLILLIGALVLASLLLSTAMSFILRFFSDLLPQVSYLFPLAEIGLSWIIMSFLFMVMFRYLPDVQMKWAYVWKGGLLTGFLFFIGKALLSWYFSAANIASSYGIAGSLVIILLWVYYSSIILFVGAEFTQVWMRHKGVEIIPQKVAMPINISQPVQNVQQQDSLKIWQKLAVMTSVLATQFRLVKFLMKVRRAWKKTAKKTAPPK